MTVTDENKEFYLQAMKVDFLTENWEIEKYMTALMVADAWGKKIDKMNMEYFLKLKTVEKSSYDYIKY